MAAAIGMLKVNPELLGDLPQGTRNSSNNHFFSKLIAESCFLIVVTYQCLVPLILCTILFEV